MKHLFLPYELAVKLKEKGFDYPVMAIYYNVNTLGFCEPPFINHNIDGFISSPLYQQAVDWFRESHSLHISTYLCGMDFICYKIQGFGVRNVELVNSYGGKNDTTGMFTSNYDALNKAIEKSLTLI